MPSSRDIQRMLRNPSLLARWQMTGRLPQRESSPKSPLIDLLVGLPPQMRARILGLTVDHRLGYQGSRRFHTAEQAFRWLCPPCGGSTPSRSWQDKRFQRKLTLRDLLACASSWPSQLAAFPLTTDCSSSGVNPGAEPALGQPQAGSAVPSAPIDGLAHQGDPGVD